jgi:hypothetical protein
MALTKGKTMKRAWVAACIILALAACRREPSQEAPAGPVDGTANGANVTGEPLPEPDINASLQAIGALHPDEAEYRFVGRWAAEAPLCEHDAWRFTDSELTTPAGAVCRFTDVRAVAGGYDIAARCTAGGPEQEDEIRIRFAESAGGMLIESERIADEGLIPCDS